MADYASLIRGKIATADSITKSLQCAVAIKPWIASSAKGVPSYGTVANYKALVEFTRKQKWMPDGRLMMTMAKVTILEPVTDVSAATRQNPIDPRDIIVLPDGRTGPILEIQQFQDAGINTPFFSEITLGSTS